MTARGAAVLVVAFCVVYALLLGDRARRLIATGELLPVVLGVAVAVLPLLGGLLVWGEVRLGAASQRLGRRLADEGGLPPDDLPRRPSGRIDRAAADAVFEERRREVEAAPDDWRTWYRLALAYGDAGDTPRGRRALRRAVALEAAERARS